MRRKLLRSDDGPVTPTVATTGPGVCGVDNAHSRGLPGDRDDVAGTRGAGCSTTDPDGRDHHRPRYRHRNSPQRARSVHRDALRGRNRPGERAGRGVRTRRAGGATKSSKGRAASGPVAGQSGGSGPAHARRPDPGADADGCGVFAPTAHPGTGDTVLVGGWLMEQGRRLSRDSVTRPRHACGAPPLDGARGRADSGRRADALCGGPHAGCHHSALVMVGRRRSVVPEPTLLPVGDLLRYRTHRPRRIRNVRLRLFLRLRGRAAFVATCAGAAILSALLLAHDDASCSRSRTRGHFQIRM